MQVETLKQAIKLLKQDTNDVENDKTCPFAVQLSTNQANWWIVQVFVKFERSWIIIGQPIAYN